jgi:hypothetical protein
MICRLFFAIFFLFAVKVHSNAQDSLKNNKILKDYMHSFTTEKFGFESPGKEFELMEDGAGYTISQKNVNITYFLLPGNYENGSKELRALKGFENIKERSVIDTFTLRKGTEPVFFVVMEYVAPAGSGFENMITFITYIPHTENVTIGVAGGYPKSLDKEMRQKLIATALTIHKL